MSDTEKNIIRTFVQITAVCAVSFVVAIIMAYIIIPKSVPLIIPIFIIIWMLVMLLALMSGGKFGEAVAEQRGDIDAIMQKNGFAKVSDMALWKEPPAWSFFPAFLPIAMWKGNWRGREFTAGLPKGFAVGSRYLLMETPNNAGATINIELNNKEQMKQNGLEDIYGRLEKMGIYSNFRFVLKRPFTTAPCFSIHPSSVIFVLQPELVNEQNFVEALNIICDMMDRLRV